MTTYSYDRTASAKTASKSTSLDALEDIKFAEKTCDRFYREALKYVKENESKHFRDLSQEIEECDDHFKNATKFITGMYRDWRQDTINALEFAQEIVEKWSADKEAEYTWGEDALQAIKEAIKGVRECSQAED